MKRRPYDTDARRWTALQEADPDAEGHFVYSVVTTGIYCRPACPSRLAHRKNIIFHHTAAEAAHAGFRPCIRCRPDGVKVRTGLRKGKSVTSTFYNAGFNSSGRFYENSNGALGMTPTQYQRGGSDTSIQYAIVPCPLGLVMIAGTSRGICSVSFGDSRSLLEEELKRDFARATIQKADSAFGEWVRAIVNHLRHPAARLDLPLDIRSTAFQKQVWQALREIPIGKTASYRDVAVVIGRPSAVRAVARACATNPVGLIIPCHRVVRSDGGISGYRWGVERKRELLKREKAG